tara:strand:- start:1419 stop:2516 length:1098 start_codon:yes stop_codon:yes gene_type:complete
MSIFGNNVFRRNIQMSEGNIYDSQSWADEFTERLSNKMGRYGEESKTKTAELVSTFNPEMMKDVYEDRDNKSTALAEAFSDKALQGLNNKLGSSLKSEKGYFATIQQQKQTLKQAKKDLTKANELYQKTGSSFRFDTTGFTAIKTSAQEHYGEFDRQVEERKQAYAEEYGAASFNDLQEGYGMSQDYYASNMSEEQYQDYQDAGLFEKMFMQRDFDGGQDNRVGQRDVLDMVMSDIIGMDYQLLAKLNTIEGTGENLLDYTGDQFKGLRDFYATSKVQGIEQANRAAELQDKLRKEGAVSAQMGKVASQKKRGKTAQESISKSKGEIDIQLRELDEQFMKNVGAFSSAPKKRKVPTVSFVEGRPE